MKRRELRECMNRLAEAHGFRWVGKTKRFVGIYNGVIVELSEWDGEVTFKFTSPTIDLDDHVLADFNDFTHCEEGGVPTNWISFLMERDKQGSQFISRQGCVVSIDGNQIDTIGIETFSRIPELVAKDFHEHGAAETLDCVTCGQRKGTTVGLLNYVYTPVCDYCWDELQFHATGGKLKTDQSVSWILVIPVLVFLTAIGGWTWGLLQQPQRLDSFGIISMLLPVCWAFGLCWIVCVFSGGVTRMLRLALFASVIISVLAGNIWGYRSFMIEEMEKELKAPIVDAPGWLESVQLYLVAFPSIWQAEVPFLIGGVLGAWIGLRMLRSEETIAVQ